MYKKNIILVFFLIINAISYGQVQYPDWSFEMKVWPFDILYPFQTGFATEEGETASSNNRIKDNLDEAVDRGANTVIFYIDDEQTFETFVAEEGFAQTLSRVEYLVEQAHARNLKAICYLNGLEVIAVGAAANNLMPSLAREYPEWLQIDLENDEMVFYTEAAAEWIPADSEDAWASPLSGWRDLFKNRITALSSTALDGIYIDATFMPGVDAFGVKWASTDEWSQLAFEENYGLITPTEIDWEAERWHKWLYFRHEVIRDYLGEMATTARSLGMVPFFESSSCDLGSGTYLANDVAFTISGGIACSPEIEPEGDFKAAFRMAKATRDANQHFPIWFLGWPESTLNARKEFAVTLCHSGNYYPTTMAIDAFTPASFEFLDLLQDSILSKRIPLQSKVLIYSMRSKNYSYEDEDFFNEYNSAFTFLSENHLDFRILPLETMTEADLVGIDHVILAGVSCISNTEFAMLNTKIITLLGTNGIKDEWGNTREETLDFQQTTPITSLSPQLPFTIQAPPSSYMEYYTDKSDSNRIFIFSYNDEITGSITINNATSFLGEVYEIGHAPQEISGTNISIPITDYITVIEVLVNPVNAAITPGSQFENRLAINNSPNPFRVQTNFIFYIPFSGSVKIQLYNSSGHLIKNILDENLKLGQHQIDFNVEEIPSGVYFATLTHDNKTVTTPIIIE